MNPGAGPGGWFFQNASPSGEGQSSSSSSARPRYSSGSSISPRLFNATLQQHMNHCASTVVSSKKPNVVEECSPYSNLGRQSQEMNQGPVPGGFFVENASSSGEGLFWSSSSSKHRSFSGSSISPRLFNATLQQHMNKGAPTVVSSEKPNVVEKCLFFSNPEGQIHKINPGPVPGSSFFENASLSGRGPSSSSSSASSSSESSISPRLFNATLQQHMNHCASTVVSSKKPNVGEECSPFSNLRRQSQGMNQGSIPEGFFLEDASSSGEGPSWYSSSSKPRSFSGSSISPRLFNATLQQHMNQCAPTVVSSEKPNVVENCWFVSNLEGQIHEINPGPVPGGSFFENASPSGQGPSSSSASASSSSESSISPRLFNAVHLATNQYASTVLSSEKPNVVEVGLPLSNIEMRVQEMNLGAGPVRPIFDSYHTSEGPSLSSSSARSSSERSISPRPSPLRVPEPRERRRRTVFTKEQQRELQKAFVHHNCYQNRVARIVLATNLNLEEQQVKIWFQNQRTLLKKDKESRRTDHGCSSVKENRPSSGAQAFKTRSDCADKNNNAHESEEFCADDQLIQSVEPIPQPVEDAMLSSMGEEFCFIDPKYLKDHLGV